MTALQALQKRLDDLGLRDIKLFRTGQVTEDSLIEILTPHLDGKVTKLGLIGDSNIKTTQRKK